MISVEQSALLSAEIYEQKPSSWDHYWTAREVVCAHRKIGEDDTVTFMGSKLVIDWMRDAAAAVPWWDSEIGFVPLGFWIGIDAMLERIAAAKLGPLIIQGHSLGGSRARIAAGKLLVRGVKVARLCVFGSPKAGMANLRRIFEKSNLDRDSFRNMNDPVPLTPATIPPLLEWAHTEPWKDFYQHADPADLAPLRDHHMALYQAGSERYARTLAELARLPLPEQAPAPVEERNPVPVK